jgi:hypothetical protein
LPTASRSTGDANRHKCVPNKNRADFPPVLESDHTKLSRRNQGGRQCDGSERPATPQTAARTRTGGGLPSLGKGRSQLRAALRWRSQFALEPSSGFFGFHRIDQRDDALTNVIASTAFECSDVKARPAGRRGEPSIVFDPVVEFSALVTHRGSTFRVTMRGDKIRGDKMRGDKRPADLFIYRIRTPLNPTWTLGRSRGRGRPFSSTSRGAGLAHALAPIDRCCISGLARLSKGLLAHFDFREAYICSITGGWMVRWLAVTI